MLRADTRVFVSVAGTLLEAEIVSVSGDNVTLKRKSDAQSLVINRKTLCREDGNYIDRWLDQHPDRGTDAPAPPSPAAADSKAAPAQKYRIVCQTLPSKSARSPADSDHRTVEISYNFNLSNQEVRRDLQDGKGVAFTLGKSVGDSNGDFIVLQKEEFDINLRAQSKMVYSTKPMRLTYNQESAYGVKSYGYVLIIRDAAGTISLVEASPDGNAKFVKELLTFGEVPCVVDRDFKIKPNADVPMGYISF